MDNPKQFTHLSLCTGYGGLDIGLKRAIRNFRTICYVEVEAYAVANLVDKIESSKMDSAPIWSNLKTFDFSKFRGRVDILSGGFPCQPFSKAGRRKGTDDPRHIWPYIKRGIEQSRPAFIFLENVLGITNTRTPKGIPVLLHVLRELHSIGYKAKFTINRASEFGAKHHRPRVFILAKNPCYFPDRALDKQEFQRSYETLLNPEQKKGTTSSRSGLYGLSRLSLGGNREQNRSKLCRQIRALENSTVFFGGYNDDPRWMDRDQNWTEQINLLGNGVVPDQAEGAFRELYESFMKEGLCTH